MTISLTHLRANLYKIVDQVIETGVPIEIERNGTVIKLIPIQKKKKLDNLTKHSNVLSVDPEEIVHIDWSHEWKGKKVI
ncbi:MAG: type II toxin-antitoxin system Phd/YefM family antitoxin [Gammaproteobacteria bacterium]